MDGQILTAAPKITVLGILNVVVGLGDVPAPGETLASGNTLANPSPSPALARTSPWLARDGGSRNRRVAQSF